MSLPIRLVRVHTDTLLAEKVNQQGAGLVHHLLAFLILLDAIDILVEQVSRVHWSSLSFGVELGGENGSSSVDHSLVGRIVQVDKVLLPIGGQGAGINGITVVLGGDVTFAGGKVKSWDVVSTVTILELDGLCTSSECEQLVTHADAHDGNLGRLDQLSEVVDSLLAVSWVSRAVGNENTIKVVGDLVDRIVVREASDRCTTGNEGAEDVLLDTTIDESHVHVTNGRADMERCLRGDTADKVDSFRVDESLVFVGIVLFTDGDAGQRRTLLSQVGYNLTGIHAGDGWHTFTSAPLGKRLDGSPVRVLKSNIGHDNTRGLDVGRLEIAEKAKFVTGVRRHAIVADQWLGEDKNLTTVGRVRHRLWVTNEGSGENGFTRDVRLGTERFPVEDRSIL